MIDYEELTNLTSADIDNLSKLVKEKLDEITKSVNTLIDIGDKSLLDRQGAFNRHVTRRNQKVWCEESSSQKRDL